MRTDFRFLYIVTALLVLIAGSTSLTAAEDQEVFRIKSVKLGMIGSGTVEVNDQELDQKRGFSFGLAWELPFGPRFHTGLAADIMWLRWRGDSLGLGFDDTEALMDLHTTVKGNIDAVGERLTLRPGVGIGWGQMGRQARLNPMNFLTLRASFEVIYWLPRNRGIVLEAVYWNAPSGGDDQNDVTIGPAVLLRAGFAF